MASKTSTANKTTSTTTATTTTNRKKKAPYVPTPRVLKAIEDRVAAYEADEVLPRLGKVSDKDLVYILKTTELRIQNEYPVDEIELEKALAATRPVATLPPIDCHVKALRMIFSLPEMISFWANWRAPGGRRGPTAGWACARALMLAGALGVSSHMKQSFTRLHDPAVQGVLDDVEKRAAKLLSAPTGRFRMIVYKSVMKVIPRLVAPLGGIDFSRRAMECNVALLKELVKEFPDGDVGRYLGIDGTPVPAWVLQVGKKELEEEARITKHHPEAAPRAYTYTNDGKRDVVGKQKVSASLSKFWRGYALVPLVDIATGRPVVWVLVSAKINEHDLVDELLRLLFEIWPDAPVTALVGDSAYDIRETYELCELKYGIHLIAVRKPSHARHGWDVDAADSKRIHWFNGRGVTFCRKHKQPMKLVGYEFSKRDGLEPGESSKVGGFRVRAKCMHDKPGDENKCGTPGLPMSLDWSAFPFYPHHGGGMPARHAMRVALQARRNQCEALFSSLKVGSKLGKAGADRCRLKKPALEALISLAFLLRTALMLADVRAQKARALGGR